MEEKLADYAKKPNHTVKDELEFWTKTRYDITNLFNLFNIWQSEVNDQIIIINALYNIKLPQRFIGEIETKEDSLKIDAVFL